ncbi:MAG TPA: hydroxymethylpyrimidine/phosphomethylpyrimidine kinase [Gammaproteobacteria bacterium]|nr:hydroxymethylpyrimidine/phosphomethylpyrimidine kinase [Gammaproteobacteria bacterium]
MGQVTQPPVVLVIAGNDPTGGAGLAADIQAITAAGAHPAPVVAAITVQDTGDVRRVQAVDPALVVEQARAVLQDMPVAAVKLGLLADAAVGHAVAALLAGHGSLPLVVDPVLAASGGGRLADDELLEIYKRELVPLATLVTPNAAESRRFAPTAADPAGRAKVMLASGAQYVLVKGADEDAPEVRNHLFGPDGFHRESVWVRLPHSYHGSGCTLASAIAARLALGQAMPDAVQDAQRYTYDTLRRGWRPGRHQHLPRR